MSETWNTSVTEIVTIFRDALIALIPTFERAKINWKENEYDDFDNIAEALYQNIVCASLTGEVATFYNLPRYALYQNDYSQIGFIEVIDEDKIGERFAFIAFQNSLTPFDTVRAAKLDKMNKVIGYANLVLGKLKFVYVRNNGNESSIVDTIEVIL